MFKRFSHDFIIEKSNKIEYRGKYPLKIPCEAECQKVILAESADNVARVSVEKEPCFEC